MLLLKLKISEDHLKLVLHSALFRRERLLEMHEKRTRAQSEEMKELGTVANIIVDALGAVVVTHPDVTDKEQAASKELKLFNGRWGRGGADHIYVAAHSQADAIRVVNELYGDGRLSMSELKGYWSKGAWGTNMDGITPERGAWVVRRDMNPDRQPPARITPENAKDYK